MENSIALKDPVCGMAVTDKSFHQSEHMGQRFYFCGTKCKAKFAAHALRYGGEPGAPAAAHLHDAPPAGFQWGRGWLLAAAALLLLVVAGLWLA